MKLVLRLLFLLPLLAALPRARAADLSGTWKGAFDFQGSSVPVTLHLKIDGTKVTGTVEGLPTTPTDIHDGALAGDTVTFWVNTDYEGQTYKLVYKGKVAPDQISFDFGTEDGSFSAPLTVKRGGEEAAAPPPPPAARARCHRRLEGNLRSQRHFHGAQVPSQEHRSRGDRHH